MPRQLTDSVEELINEAYSYCRLGKRENSRISQSDRTKYDLTLRRLIKRHKSFVFAYEILTKDQIERQEVVPPRPLGFEKAYVLPERVIKIENSPNQDQRFRGIDDYSLLRQGYASPDPYTTTRETSSNLDSRYRFVEGHLYADELPDELLVQVLPEPSRMTPEFKEWFIFELAHKIGLSRSVKPEYLREIKAAANNAGNEALAANEIIPDNKFERSIFYMLSYRD